jgi:hypothetical protein
MRSWVAGAGPGSSLAIATLVHRPTAPAGISYGDIQPAWSCTRCSWRPRSAACAPAGRGGRSTAPTGRTRCRPWPTGANSPHPPAGRRESAAVAAVAGCHSHLTHPTRRRRDRAGRTRHQRAARAGPPHRQCRVGQRGRRDRRGDGAAIGKDHRTHHAGDARPARRRARHAEQAGRVDHNDRRPRATRPVLRVRPADHHLHPAGLVVEPVVRFRRARLAVAKISCKPIYFRS